MGVVWWKGGAGDSRRGEDGWREGLEADKVLL